MSCNALMTRDRQGRGQDEGTPVWKCCVGPSASLASLFAELPTSHRSPLTKCWGALIVPWHRPARAAKKPQPAFSENNALPSSHPELSIKTAVHGFRAGERGTRKSASTRDAMHMAAQRLSCGFNGHCRSTAALHEQDCEWRDFSRIDCNATAVQRNTTTAVKSHFNRRTKVWSPRAVANRIE